MIRRKRKIAYAIIVGVLFFFLAPVVPAEVYPKLLLPDRNYCGSGPIIISNQVQVFGSVSYVISSLATGIPIGYSAVGLVYVPYWGRYTIQFALPGFGGC